MSGSKKSGSTVEKPFKKSQYYVWYLGWKECRGLGGREFTEPIVKELIHRRTNEELPKLTIEVSRKEVKIVQLVENRRGKIDKIKYPPVLSKDVTYAVQALSPDEDVVACIFLGYNPHTKCAVHVHVYRCDSVETAQKMVSHMTQLAAHPEHAERARRIERELASKGQVVPRPGVMPIDDEDDDGDYRPPSARFPPTPQEQARSSWGPQQGSASPGPPGPPGGIFRNHHHDGAYRAAGYRNSAPVTDEDYQSQMFDSLADELRAKLGKTPLLLPAKDYDTINRIRGNAFDAPNRKCLNADIVGGVAAKGSKLDSTGDSAKGDSEEGSQRDDADRSPRSLKSSGRFSAGFGELDPADDPELAGLSSPRSAAVVCVGYSQPAPRPFSPGPNTHDLKKASYFGAAGDKSLPGYLPNNNNNGMEPMKRSNGGGSNGSSGSGYGGANNPGAVYGRQGSHDEGYTSLDRREYAGRYGGGAGPYSPRGGDVPRQQGAPRYEEPPIDYTIAVRGNQREVPHSRTVFR